MGIEFKRQKYISSIFFLCNFAQGHLCFHVLMFLQKLKAVPKSLTEGILRIFLKSIYMSMTAGLTGSLSPTYVPVDYLHLSLTILPYVWQCAISQVTSLAQDW